MKLYRHATGACTLAPGLRPGLSLLEVLLATVIFMMSVAGLSVLIGTAVDNALSASRSSLGSSLASSKMAELESGATDIDLSSGGTGTFTDQPDWNYDITSSSVAANCYEVTVTVWVTPDLNKRDAVKLVQYIFDPSEFNTAAKATAPAATTGGTGSTP